MKLVKKDLLSELNPEYRHLAMTFNTKAIIHEKALNPQVRKVRIRKNVKRLFIRIAGRL